MPTRLETATPQIVSFFADLGAAVYRQTDVQRIFRENREKWRLAVSTTFTDFLKFLISELDFRRVRLKSEFYPSVTRYAYANISAFRIALSMRPRSYLSHGTAVFLHSLTDEIPKAIHVNTEQRPKPAYGAELSQAGLDRAFSRPQRMSRYVFTLDGNRVVLLNGKHTDHLGVTTVVGADGEELPVTDLERTLIDIVVRPAYAGGVIQVLEAYRGAINRVSPEKLAKTLRELGHLYPYHQAIGFLMERAGFAPEFFEQLRAFGMTFDFYLVHGAKKTEYDERWRLFYPQGL